MQKNHSHCKTPGCMEVGVCQPHEQFPNVLFCEKHGNQLLIATVKSIADGTNPDLQDDD